MKKMYRDIIGTFTGTGTSYAAITGSPYSPLKSGTLKAIEIHMSGQAATSLLEQLTLKLSNPLWTPSHYACASGAGIRTAPATPIPTQKVELNLPIQIGSPITVEAKWNVTAVTPNVTVIGIFS